MGKNKNKIEEVFDELIQQFDKLGNLPIGAKSVVLILKHYKDRYKEEK